MTVLEKVLISILVLVLVIGGGLFAYEKVDSAKRLQAMSDQITSQKQLTDNITRSLSTYATKQDMDQMAADSKVNLAAIQKDISSIGATLSAMNKVTVDSTGENVNNLGSTSTTPNTTSATQNSSNPDPYGYQKNIQNLRLDEDFANNVKVPIGDVSFDASKDKPWSVIIAAREYQSVTTLAVDDGGKYTAYNNFSINVDGKNYPINVTNSKLIQQQPANHFTFWPRLYLGLDGGATVVPLQPELTPGVSVGVIGYGKSKVQPDLSILQVGAGYGVVSKNLEFTLVPIAYNLGSKIPLMSNFYVGPQVSMDIQGHFTAGIGIRVGL